MRHSAATRVAPPSCSLVLNTALEMSGTFVMRRHEITSPAIRRRVYVLAMSIADFEQLLILMPIHRDERTVLREGYVTLVRLGWPTCYINWRMCERAQAGLIQPYQGVQSWLSYRREWAWSDSRRHNLPSTAKQS